MGTHLRQALRSLCHKTDWKYAVFWKLKHRSRMMLNWEDGYYDNTESTEKLAENVCSNDAPENSHDGCDMRDPVGLAVAKMSYLVYSLGEGIIGQVAFTGKHQWIFAKKPTSNSCLTSEYSNGWQAQFATGIKTIAVVAVLPHGVVQLGSLNTIIEDLKLVDHIKDLFGSLQNIPGVFLPDPTNYMTENNSSPVCLPHVEFQNSLVLQADDSTPFKARSEALMKNSDLVVSNNCPRILNQIVNQRSANRSQRLPSLRHGNDLSKDVPRLSGFYDRNVAEVVDRQNSLESSSSGDDRSILRSIPGNLNRMYQKQEKMKLSGNKRYRDQDRRQWIETSLRTGLNVCVSTYRNPSVGYSCSSSSLLDPGSMDRIESDQVLFLKDKGLHLPESLEIKLHNDAEKSSKLPAKINCSDTVTSVLKFSAGCELHEALGSALRKEQGSCVWSEVGMSAIKKPVENFEPLDGVVSNWFTPESESEHLLEAVVANAFSAASNLTSDNMSSKSTESLLTTINTPPISNHIKYSSKAAIGGFVGSSSLPPTKVEKNRSSSSFLGSVELVMSRSPKELSSNTPITCSDHLEKSIEPAKVYKKRARPGESCRPRPRDRQLIQDRVKELREIVPNGSKCSIDALLERTIKHMLFLQSITSHADKLKKCNEFKLLDKGSDLLGSRSNASWAVELGSQSEVCPILVENLNQNGQMLVEMLCEECSLFLQIAEVIRSLGLTILKGVTETRAKKTWACFLVEGPGNRSLQTVDILWSLMPLLRRGNSNEVNGNH